MIRFALDRITSFSSLPFKFTTFARFVVSGITFIMILYALYSRFIPKNYVRGETSLMLAVLSISGVQLISIRIFGEYTNCMNINTKNRPISIISEEEYIFGARQTCFTEPESSVRRKACKISFSILPLFN